MVFETYAYTNQGGRKNNEDYCKFEDGIWVLADGLGGHDRGEVASEAASVTTVNLWKSMGKPMDDDELINLIKDVNSEVVSLRDDNSVDSMRTTLVFAVTDGKELRYANVGDSRFYLFRDNTIIRQSEDHSVSAAMAKIGEIGYEDIRFDENRNKLLKVIGNDEKIKIKAVDPSIRLEPGDAFLLCSDGFWEYVFEQEMEIDLSKSETPAEWISYMAKRILLRTENVNNDNFTAICVMVGE